MTIAPTRGWVEYELIRRSFARFLPYWHFKNRESGRVMTFRPEDTPCPTGNPRCNCVGAGLWPGQARLAEEMERYPWLFALKAGKLGFTELECAWDGWVLLFTVPNARVHLFSKDLPASRGLLRYVRFGLAHLPKRWGVEFLSKKAGGSTSVSLIVRHKWCADDDERECVSYAATGQVAIDQSAMHSHVDELSHMQEAEALWNSVITTVTPEGTCHIVTRGAGDGVYTAELWEAANSAQPELQGFNSYLRPFFARYDERPDRNAESRAALAASGTYTVLGLSYYQPETPEDALAGDESSPYIPLDVWDRLAVPRDLQPPFLPGDRTPIVLSLDAAITSDCFAVAAVSRHWDPVRAETDVAIRATRKWAPADFEPGEDGIRRIDFEVAERWCRFVIEGGCQAGHPRSMPLREGNEREGWHYKCGFCERGEWTVPGYNVVQLCYDPYQLEDMATRIRRDHLTWVKAFDQGTERLIGDGTLFRLAMQGRLAHNGDPDVREHIGNAKAKLQTDQESQMRIIKKSPGRKIDLAVAIAQGVKRVLDLNLT